MFGMFLLITFLSMSPLKPIFRGAFHFTLMMMTTSSFLREKERKHLFLMLISVTLLSKMLACFYSALRPNSELFFFADNLKALGVFTVSHTLIT